MGEGGEAQRCVCWSEVFKERLERSAGGGAGEEAGDSFFLKTGECVSMGGVRLDPSEV